MVCRATGSVAACSKFKLPGSGKVRPQSATAYSAYPAVPEHMTRSPALMPFTSLPTCTASPENSMPTMVPAPPMLP